MRYYANNLKAKPKKSKKRARVKKRRLLLLPIIGIVLFLATRFSGNIWSRKGAPNLPTLGSKLLSAMQQPQSKPKDNKSWKTILVNRWNPIPENYRVELTELSNGQRVDSRIYPSLQAMFDDARASGIYPVVGSGFRTKKKQQSLMDQKIAAYESEGYAKSEAKTLAEQWVAIPGTSEHELGIAVDINGDRQNSDNKAVYKWLANNAHKYGFILRYPEDKTYITGVAYEPWHYRYVGRELAEELKESGLCLEEHINRFK